MLDRRLLGDDQMKHIALTLLAFALIIATAARATAQSYTVDQPQSDGLTNYLHNNMLPLVGAQVSDGSDGSQRVMLDGFAATDSAAVNAGEMALKYLNDPRVTLVNRIKVDTTIASPVAGGSAPSAPSTGSGPDSWGAMMDDIYQEGAQTPPAQGVPTLP